MKWSRQRVLLLTLGGFALFLAWQRVRPMLLPAGPGSETEARLSAVRAPKVEALHGIDPDAVRAEYHPGRDPFHYGPPPPPPPPSEEEIAAMQRREAAEAAVRQRLAAEQAAEAAKPHPPEIDVSYLGSFGPPQRRIAVFSDGHSIYNALVGDVLHGKFIVDKIGYESVDLKFVGFPDVPPRRLAVGARKS